MNKWKIAFFSVLLVLLASNAFWLFASIDAGISYTYLSDSYQHQTQKVQNLGQLLVKSSEQYSKGDLLHLLRQAKADAFIVDEGDTVIFEDISFRFVDGRLVEVQ